MARHRNHRDVGYGIEAEGEDDPYCNEKRGLAERGVAAYFQPLQINVDQGGANDRHEREDTDPHSTNAQQEIGGKAHYGC